MNAIRHARVSEVFLQAVDLAASERAGFLEHACGSDGDLRRAVEELLKRDAAPARLDTPVVAPGLGDWLAGPDAALPARIGPYAILGLLGQGGAGTVFHARQAQPQREVALKVLNGLHAGGDALRRFEFEAAVLGRLAHPGIAQIFEADVACEPGRRLPYFAMELIRGRTLTDYAAARGLSTRRRLELLLQVCDAVAYAHRKGVIHRDLKPANILVADAAGPDAPADARPKVLDFGVARALDDDLARTQHTSAGQLIGTLAYMSPEQLAGDPAHIDTQTDVYALGVIAFELLAGRLPFELANRSVTESIDLLRAARPPRLGTFRPQLRGDLETVVAKAMQRAKPLRYASVAAFADDLQRYLRDEPTLARPPGPVRQLRMFARRNRALVTGAAAVLVALVGGTAATAWQSMRALRSEARATELAARESLARRAAEGEARKATEIRRFLQSLLGAAAHQGGRGADFTVRAALDEAAARIDAEFADMPEVRAELQITLGEGYRGLGLHRAAIPHLQAAVATLEQLHGANHAPLCTPLAGLGVSLRETGELRAGEAALARAHKLSVADSGRDSAQSNRILALLGSVRRMLGDFDEAREMLDESIANGESRATGPPNVRLLFRRAARLALEKDWPAAEALYREIVARFESERATELYASHTAALQYLAITLHRQNRCAEAAGHLATVIERKSHALGPDAIQLALDRARLAWCLAESGQTAEAERLGQQALAALRRPADQGLPVLFPTCELLAATFLDLQRPELADAVFTQANALVAAMPADARSLRCARYLADLLGDLQRDAEAERLLAAALAAADRAGLGDLPQATACRRAREAVLLRLAPSALPSPPR